MIISIFNKLSQYKIKKIHICTFLIFFILFFLLIIYNSFAVNEGHDRLLYVNISSLTKRWLPYSIVHIYNHTLPNYFHYMNSTDFKCSLLGVLLISAYYFLSVYVFSGSFFLLANSREKSIFTVESNLLFLICYMLLTDFFVNTDDYFYFQGIRENWIYIDHVGGCIFYFLYFILLTDIIVNNKSLSFKEKLLYSILGLSVGLWTEILNLSVLFSIFSIFICLYFIDKEKLKNISIYYLFISFIIGFILYYFFIGNYDLTHIGTIGYYDILGRLAQNFQDINVYLSKFYSLYIYNKRIFVILIFMLSAIIGFSLMYASLCNRQQVVLPEKKRDISVNY